MLGFNFGTRLVDMFPTHWAMSLAQTKFLTNKECTSGVNCFIYLSQPYRTVMMAGHEDLAVSLKRKCCQHCVNGVNHH